MTTLTDRDKKIIWHPFTQEKTANDVIPIKKGKGIYLYDENGKEYMDLISSWWVNIHGHANEEIAHSIYNQAKQLEHVIFAGFTHEPAVVLCEELQKILPQQLCRFFFSDNGSTAVEVALKMAYQYWYNRGQKQRKLFLSFEGGYHGDTFGAMSVGFKSGFHDVFDTFFFKVLNIPYPHTWDGDDKIEAKENAALEKLSEYIEQNGQDIAALILEPLIQGASGMRICRASFVKKVVELVRQHGILVIFDEIMTGFYRTGTYFAMFQIGLTPDFICMSKGITGGFMPLAVTATTNEIYEAFLSEKWEFAFTHGHSYTANPLACAAAITSLKLLNGDDTKSNIQVIDRVHIENLKILSNKCKNISRIRSIGTIAAFDVQNTSEMKKKLQIDFLRSGLLLRPLDDTVYILPPYCITQSELEIAYDKIEKVIRTLY